MWILLYSMESKGLCVIICFIIRYKAKSWDKEKSPAYLIRFIMKKIQATQLSDVFCNLALILFRLYPFFPCPNLPSTRFRSAASFRFLFLLYDVCFLLQEAFPMVVPLSVSHVLVAIPGFPGWHKFGQPAPAPDNVHVWSDRLPPDLSNRYFRYRPPN